MRTLKLTFNSVSDEQIEVSIIDGMQTYDATVNRDEGSITLHDDVCGQFEVIARIATAIHAHEIAGGFEVVSLVGHSFDI